MLKKHILNLTLILFVIGFQSISTSAARTDVGFSQYTKEQILVECSPDLKAGVLAIKATGTQNGLNFLLEHGDQSYHYHLQPGERSNFPLNMGDGKYKLSLRLYVMDNYAETIWVTTTEIKLSSPLAPFLSSSKIVHWNAEMELSDKAKKISSDLSQYEGALAICNYITNRYHYSDKTVPKTYIPDLQKIFQVNTGICYDFAALLTAMCRSVDIPAKLQMGYSGYMGGNQYHAWVEIYDNVKWHMLDPTLHLGQDSTYLDSTQTEVVKSY